MNTAFDSAINIGFYFNVFYYLKRKKRKEKEQTDVFLTPKRKKYIKPIILRIFKCKTLPVVVLTFKN